MEELFRVRLDGASDGVDRDVHSGGGLCPDVGRRKYKYKYRGYRGL